MAGVLANAMLSACHSSNNENTETGGKITIAQVDTEKTGAESLNNIADVRLPDVKIHVKRGQPLFMQTKGLTLTAYDVAVQHEADYSVTSLVGEELPPLPQGMMNMTASTAGYRLLPGGEHFLPYAELRMTYDPERLPEGYTPDDIYTSYYDTATLAWVRLERVEVDTVNHEIVSLTTHFTDFINELLKAPEMPETQAFVPTAMSDLEAVSPMDGLTMIQPPTANNNGTANVSYPLLIPAGRNGMQPNLALNYNSANGSGWLGVGWDIPVPSITLDTRWGVPRYNATYETEIYLLDGEQLITKEADGTPRLMPHRTNQQTYRTELGNHVQFYARFGDAHDSITRHGDSPQNYWWEVTDRTGTTHYYGHYVDESRGQLPATLCDDLGNIARWPLCESRDLYGNTVRYYYDLATVRNRGAVGRQLYLDSISYTGHGADDGYYTVVFCRVASDSIPDIPVSCNNGFKEITDQQLNNVYVKSGDSIMTVWLFDMENAYKTNYKNRLTTVAKIDSVANGMRNLLAWRCHCIQTDEDEDSVMRYIVNSHEEYLTRIVYDTTYTYTKHEEQNSLGETIIVYDTIPVLENPHEIIETIIVYDTIRYPVRPISLIDRGYAGSIYQFSYYDAPEPANMFGPEVESNDLSTDHLHGFLVTDPLGIFPISKATGIGLSHSSSWNVGGAAAGGLGPAVCLTTLSLGGNYTRSESASESLMTLVDIDGDGYADKVFLRNGKMYYRKHIHSGNSITFSDTIRVKGVSHFLQESSYSNTFGGQLAVGFSGSVSWTNAKSTTSTYFADVNGDGLIDIVDNGQVLFNSLDSDGHPEFRQYETSQHLTEGDETESEPVITSTSECRGIIFDGKVNDSITCERIWVSTDSVYCSNDIANNYVNRYHDNPDTLVKIEPVGEEQGMVMVRLYHREWDCSYHDDSPNTEAVRVWIAPRNGQINLSSRVGLKRNASEARRAARHADGVVYTYQHTSGVNLSANPLTATTNDILRTFDICDTCYYNEDNPTNRYTYDSTFNVSKGDMLFFRLRSKVNRQFDDVYEWHTIQYQDGDGEQYVSNDDFVLSSDYCFQAPVDGHYFIEGDFTDNSNDFGLQIKVEGNVLPTGYYGHGTHTLSENNFIHKDSTICFTVSSSSPNPQWGKVECRPYVIFVPESTQYRYDTNRFTNTIDTIRFTDEDIIEGWIPCRMDIVHEGYDTVYNRTILRRLFGPLYKGWGQFAYHQPNTGSASNIIRIETLVPPDMLVVGASMPSDTNGFRERLHRGDGFTADSLTSDSTYDSFQSNHEGLYNPLSYASCWVEMTPDVEHQVWVSYGRQNYVGRDSISNSLQGQWYSSSATVAATTDIELPETTTYDDAVPAASPNGTPAKAVRKVNRSTTESWTLGAAALGGSGSTGTNTVVTDYMDLNGDRYPDNVGHERVQYSQQWGGLGEMRDFPPDFAKDNNSTTTTSGNSCSASPIRLERIIGGAMFTLKSEANGGLSKGYNKGQDRASGAWTDINGDGLADFVTCGGKVYLNIGYGFLDKEDWHYNTIHSGMSETKNTSITVGAGQTLSDNFLNVWQGSIQYGESVSGSHNQTTAMMIDINGDGLPDKVWRNPTSTNFKLSKCSSSATYVSFNKGNGKWSNTMQLDFNCFHRSANHTESINEGLTYGATFFGTFKVTVGADGSPYSGSVNRDSIQLVDVDADGLPDLVSSDSENQLIVRYNQCGRTNLLKSVTNFNSADFQIEYELSDADYNQPSRSWLMSKVTTHDALNSHNGATTTVTEYAYAEPHYDRFERTSYGYGTVVTSDVTPATANVYRTVERNYYNNNMLRRGQIRREMTRDGNGNPYIERLHRCTYVDYIHGNTVNVDTLCPEISYPTKDTMLTNFYEGNTAPQLTTGEIFEYDRYHNVTKYTDMGDTADHTDGLVVDFRYFGGLQHNLVGLRKRYAVIPTGSADTMRKARFEYDATHGKPTRQVLYNGSDSAVYDFVYESTFGNLQTAMQPKNTNGERMTYSYTYDNVVHTYPTEIVNSYGETMNSTYDYRYGKPLTVADPSGSTMTYCYDFAGRLVSVNSPLNTSGTPSLVNQYHPMNYYHNSLNPQGYTFNESPTHHPYSVSMHYDDNGSLITATAVLTNGYGQTIQTKKGLRVGSADKMQVSGRVVVDAFGRTVEQYDPVTEPRTSHWGEYNTGYSAASLTTTAYDVLDRTTSTVQPLGVTTQAAYSIGDDQGEHHRFVTTMTDPNGNVTTQYADYEGRKVQVTDANGEITLMHYDNLGQLASATDPEGFTTTYEYDMLGRMTKRIHPDAGETRYTYDNAGNLLEEQNPLGQIFYDYTYYRVLNKRYSNMTGNNVTYTYGTSGTSKGRPIHISDGTGSHELTYDALGNVTAETRIIVLPNSHEEFSLTMNYEYDSWGRMLSITYPDGEEVSYTYQWGGDLSAMQSVMGVNTRTYIGQIQYNDYGQKSHVTYGNSASAEYSYDALHRLTNLKCRDGSNTLMQDIDYTYDNASNVTGIANSAGAVNTLGGGYGNTYQYDALHRLVGSTGGGASTGTYDMDMGYTGSGRIKAKYRSSLSPTLSGTVKMYYGYCDEYQPHAVRRIYDEYNQKHYDFRWDASGNLGQVSYGNEEALFESGRFMYWTEDNRMHVAVDDNHYSYYAYDYSGERRIKLTGDNSVLDVNAEFMSTISTLENVTLYPSAYMVLTDRGYTKHYYTGMERVAARIGDGGLDVGIYLSNTDSLHARANRLFSQSLAQVNGRVLEANDVDCVMEGMPDVEELGIPFEAIPEQMLVTVGTEYGEFVGAMHLVSNAGESPEVYYYHGDHLGSASWITDASGAAVQHLQYLPFGERFVDQRTSGYCERFTFTGKERDEETGFGYFGARYMDHELMTMWLSVDPMSDKYPSISPYAYCAWNPVKLIDPDGQEIYVHYKGVDYYLNIENNKAVWISKDGRPMKFTGAQPFYNKLTKCINKLLAKPVGKSLIEGMVNDKEHSVQIVEAKRNDGANYEEGKVYWTGDSYANTGKYATSDFSNGGTPNFVRLAHELAHFYGKWTNYPGMENPDKLWFIGSDGIPRYNSETWVLSLENKIRHEHRKESWTVGKVTYHHIGQRLNYTNELPYETKCANVYNYEYE